MPGLAEQGGERFQVAGPVGEDEAVTALAERGENVAGDLSPGRDRVAVLNKGVEEPSDVDGLMYIKYPDGPWKIELARELRAAGLESDPTKA